MAAPGPPIYRPPHPANNPMEFPGNDYADRQCQTENFFDLAQFRRVPGAAHSIEFIEAMHLEMLLAPPPIDVSLRLIRLFYQNMKFVSAPLSPNGFAFIRLRIDNWLYNLQATDLACAFNFYVGRPMNHQIDPAVDRTHESMINILCGGQGSGMSIKRAALPMNLLFWDIVMSNNLLPHGTKSERTKNRVVALHAAHSNTWFDAPGLMLDEMWRCHNDIQTTTSVHKRAAILLNFPHYVMHLLAQIGCPIFDDEEMGDMQFYQYGLNVWNKSIKAILRTVSVEHIQRNAEAHPPHLNRAQRQRGGPRRPRPDEVPEFDAETSFNRLDARVEGLSMVVRNMYRRQRFQNSLLVRMARESFPNQADGFIEGARAAMDREGDEVDDEEDDEE